MPTSVKSHSDKLREARERLGINMTEACRRAGLRPPRWHAYENGKALSLEVVRRLAIAIGADPHEVDPKLASTVRPLTLVPAYESAESSRVVFIGETDEDDQLVKRFLPGGSLVLRRSTLEGLWQRAMEEGVAVLIRTDLSPREPQESEVNARRGCQADES